MATGVSAGGFAEFRPDCALVCPGLLLPLLRVTLPEPPLRIPGPYHTGWARGPRRERSSRLATGACVYLWKALTGRRNCVRNNRHKSTDLLAGSFRVLGKDKTIKLGPFIYKTCSEITIRQRPVMQSAAKHLAWGTHSLGATVLITTTSEMLRCTLHDRPLSLFRNRSIN